MRVIKVLTIIYVVLFFNIPLILFTQTTDLLSGQRGVRVLAKDSQTGQEKSIHLYKKVYAVIIGIDLYKNLSPDQQLRYPVKDAKGIEKMLRDRFVFDEIIALYNSEASRDAIMSTLLGKLSQTGSNDAVFIFFAGHGYTDTTPYGELGYLVPFDGSFEKKDLFKNISMTQLKEDVSKAIPAKHVFFMIDSCYSGLLVMRGSNPETHRDLNYMQKITKESVRQVLTAGGQDEKVLDGGPFGHSVFVGRILEILNDTSDFMTASELSVKVKERVFSDARGMGHIQTPAFGAFFGLGDFVFIPRADTRLEEINAEISKYKTQLVEIDSQKKEAEKIKSEKEIRDAKRKEEDIKAQLKVKQLEQERLQKEKERKASFEEEQKRFSAEEAQKKLDLENKKKVGEEELEKLRQKFAEEDAKIKNIKRDILSIDSARKEVVALEEKTKTVESTFTIEKDKALKRLNEDYDLLEKEMRKPIPPKGEFETTAGYNTRIENEEKKSYSLRLKYTSDYWEIRNKYENEIAERTKVYKNQIDDLKSRKYPAGEIKVELLNYNADKGKYSVRLTDNRGIVWYYLLSVVPEIAKGLFERKELLKAEGYYSNFDNPNSFNSFSDVFLIDPVSGKHLFDPANNKLRSNYLTVSFEEGKSMLESKGFYDARYNPSGDSKSQFELIEIVKSSGEKEKAVLDFTTGLMWHQSGNSGINALFSPSLQSATKWIAKLNKTGYAGCRDWRFPTLEEAASLLKNPKNESGNILSPIFSIKQNTIWTGDKNPTNNPWCVNFTQGFSIFLTTSNQGIFSNVLVFVRPVRSMN